MLEHVGSKNIGEFFDVNRRLLTDDGIALHHTIGSNIWKDYNDPWFDRYIFPGRCPPVDHAPRRGFQEHLGHGGRPQLRAVLRPHVDGLVPQRGVGVG